MKKIAIGKIIDDIFSLDSPCITDSRKDQLKNFVITTINGDTPRDHLAITANLSDANSEKGVIVYILTNLRVIKIDISLNEVQSNSYPIETLIGVNRKLIDGDRAQYSVSFQNGSFGLSYSQSDTKITNFFQLIDQVSVENEQ